MRRRGQSALAARGSLGLCNAVSWPKYASRNFAVASMARVALATFVVCWFVASRPTGLTGARECDGRDGHTRIRARWPVLTKEKRRIGFIARLSNA